MENKNGWTGWRLITLYAFGKDKNSPGPGAFRMCIIDWRWGSGGIIIMQELLNIT